MRITIVSLLLSLAVLLCSIELSSQAQSESETSNTRRSHSPPWKVFRGWSSTQDTQPRRMSLPHPYYYDSNGIIRSRDLPEAYPMMNKDKSFFYGMAKGEHFFPIIQHGQYKIFNIREHKITSMSQDEFEILLNKVAFPTSINSPRGDSSPNSPGPSTTLQLRVNDSSRTSSGPSTNLQLRPPGQY